MSRILVSLVVWRSSSKYWWYYSKRCGFFISNEKMKFLMMEEWEVCCFNWETSWCSWDSSRLRSANRQKARFWCSCERVLIKAWMSVVSLWSLSDFLSRKYLPFK